MGTWVELKGPGSGTTPEVVGAPTAVALSPTPGGWASNPRYRLADDGVSQLVDTSIRVTPANDVHVAGFDIVIDKATGVLTPITGFYPYTNTVPATQDYVVTAVRPQTNQTWVYVVATRGDNGAFDPPDETITATKVSVSITGYSPGTGASTGVSGFSVSIIDDASSPVAQSHFKFFFTPPADPNFYRVEIFMIFCDDPATHGGAYVPKSGATQFLVAGARTSPSEQTSWWPRGSIGSWILATATPENILGIPNVGSNATFGFFLGPATSGKIPDNNSADPVTGFSIVIVDDTSSPVAQSRFRMLFTPPSDPDWVSANLDMVFCDDPALHGGSYVPASGQSYFPVGVGIKTSPAEQTHWWPRGSVGSYILARATSLNLLGILNTGSVATYGFFLSPATGGRIPDNNTPSLATGFSVVIIDDPSSPVPQSHFRFIWTNPVDTNFIGIHVDMIFCDNPALHGGAYVPSSGAQWFLVVPKATDSPAEQTGWWPRGSVQGWLTARALSINLLGQTTVTGPTYNFTITPGTGVRLDKSDATTVGLGMAVASGKLQADIGNGVQFVGNHMTVNAAAPLAISGAAVTVQLNSIQSTHLAAGSLGDLSKYSSTVRAVGVVSSLPTLPDANYPTGAIVFNTTTGKLHRNVSGTWSTSSDPQDIIAGSIAASVAFLGTLTLNLNGVTTSINNTTGLGGTSGIVISDNSSNAKLFGQKSSLKMTDPTLGGVVSVLEVLSSGGGRLILQTNSSAAGIVLVAGSGSGATMDMAGAAAYIHLNNGGNITVFSGGYVDAYGGFRVQGNQRITANGGLMPRQAGNFASLAALSTSLGANWLAGEMIIYFNSALSKQCWAFKDNLSGNHHWIES